MKGLVACMLLVATALAEPPVDNRYLPPSQRGADYRTTSQDSFAPPAQNYGAPAPARQTQALLRNQEGGFGSRSQPSSQYGAPSRLTQSRSPSQQYGPPRNGPARQSAPSKQYIPPSNQYSAPSAQYNAPSAQYRAPSNQLRSSNAGQFNAPSRQYNAPSAQYNAPSAQYNAPSSQYSAPSRQDAPLSRYSSPSQQFDVPSSQYGAPSQQYNAPSQQYNAPGQGRPSEQYGPPSNQYLPPSGRNGKLNGYAGDDESNNEPANYNFEYMVKDEESGNDFGHRESRQGERAEGLYYVLLPDGRKQTVEYEADEEGYRPKISYEDSGAGAGGRGYDANSQDGSGPY